MRNNELVAKFSLRFKHKCTVSAVLSLIEDAVAEQYTLDKYSLYIEGADGDAIRLIRGDAEFRLYLHEGQGGNFWPEDGGEVTDGFFVEGYQYEDPDPDTAASLVYVSPGERGSEVVEAAKLLERLLKNKLGKLVQSLN